MKADRRPERPERPERYRWFIGASRFPNMLLAYLILFWNFHFWADPLDQEWARVFIEVLGFVLLLAFLVEVGVWLRDKLLR